MSIANQIINSVNNNNKIVADDIIKSDIPDYNIQPIEANTTRNIITPNVSPSELKQPELYKPEPMSYFSIVLYSILIIVFATLFLIYYTKINIFNYLGNIVDEIYNFFFPLINFFNYLIYGTFIQSGKSTTEGGEKIVDIATSEYENEEEEEKEKNIKKVVIKDKLKSDVNNSNKKDSLVETDDVNSEIQKKSNWCYIGEDQGIRKCVKMKDQVCLSNDIYPNYNSCVYPK